MADSGHVNTVAADVRLFIYRKEAPAVSRNPRRLSLVCDRLDDHEEALRRAFADGVIDGKEEVAIYGQVTAISGTVACLDCLDLAAEALRENGMTPYVRRRLREAEMAYARLGWTLLPGGLSDDNEAA